MAVIGNVTSVVTRHFCLPLRNSVYKKIYRQYSISATKTAIRCSDILQRILQVELPNPRIILHKAQYQTQVMGPLSPLDPSSFSRPELAVIKHIDLYLNVDFEKKILNGVANLKVETLDNIEELVLDSSDISIESIELEDGTHLKYTLSEVVPNYGSKLSITLPEPAASGQKSNDKEDIVSANVTEICIGMKVKEVFDGSTYKPSIVVSTKSRTYNDSIKDETNTLHPNTRRNDSKTILNIKIKYTTSPTATALQWLEPNQTSGKKHPYLFSQCQPIHARSIVPCQDTPAVKFTYTAEVSAPEEFTVLMSAIREENKVNKTTFRQPVPIPAYLLAIAVAVLESRELGPRSSVWSEKDEIERSAWEFAETERYLRAAEALCGPYQWTRYDLLVLPPSFPYGGMENPCLTFVTPTLLAGDRSQADVIVHEIMHSWTGNLVTNRNFEHFWLNEGFTVFLERKVAASLIENTDEAKKNRDFHSILGLQELNETICNTLGTDNPLTRLVPNLNSTHPDDSFSRVPYEKGSLFLRYLEDLVGGPGVFDDFLRSYLNKFQRKSLDTDQFKEHLLTYFKDNKNLSNVDWDTWLYKSGMPPIIPDYDTSMTKAVTSLLSKLTNGDAALDYSDIKTFTPHQMINFLQELIDRDALPLETLRALGDLYKVAGSKNAEIVYRWLRLCIKSKDEAKLNEVFAFVNNQGRMKYVRPIYRDLYAWEDVREKTIENFLKNEKYMMHVSAYTLRKDLHLTQ